MLFKNFLIASTFALLSGTFAAEEAGHDDAPKQNVGNLHVGDLDVLRARNPTLLEDMEGLVLAGSSSPTATPTGSSSSFSHVAQISPTRAPRRQKRNPGLLAKAGSIIAGADQTSSTSASSAAPSDFYSQHGKPSQYSNSRGKRALETPGSTPSSMPVRMSSVIPTPTPRPSMMKKVKST
ncbi:hypothetical protein N7448_005401 [Penicillium atrosanguineum]|uniref:Uncharacterized protein n=1 Tax=Penicillium atrosanguineum TaxID=1132637 RepID=A0A9W9PNM3_9EURO|nr:mitogen-activated protein kinase HOG1 [Penicillium atrosanguineum]KAJ5126091.1 hypothetical protein N7526_008268 [Penicillium atrosanguineum]KAJ5136847.1 hypothetical protein N7448_005401 [Penicillium atrosanguineum]KAJ5293178.1 mitogen-activated protein kinase HOG1 [Penicillium atrosanguineum]KAJ5302785.1 hypothetical protein N7476_009584 [Penicillium atrosanguineum]